MILAQIGMVTSPATNIAANKITTANTMSTTSMVSIRLSDCCLSLTIATSEDSSSFVFLSSLTISPEKRSFTVMPRMSHNSII